MSKPICSICGKSLRTRRGLKIHRTRRHGRRIRKPTYTQLYKALERSEQIRNMMTVYIVAHGLSDVCAILAKMTKDEEIKAKLEEQEAKFKALSKLTVHWATKK